MNPHNLCVCNAMFTDEQLTLLFHVGNVLMTHSHPQIITKHVKLLESENRSNDPLTVTRGKAHENLGIMLDFRIEGGCVF